MFPVTYELVVPLDSREEGQNDISHETGIHDQVINKLSVRGFVFEADFVRHNERCVDQMVHNDKVPELLPDGVGHDQTFLGLRRNVNFRGEQFHALDVFHQISPRLHVLFVRVASAENASILLHVHVQQDRSALSLGVNLLPQELNSGLLVLF